MKGKITALFPEHRLIFWLYLYLIVDVELLKNINWNAGQIWLVLEEKIFS